MSLDSVLSVVTAFNMLPDGAFSTLVFQMREYLLNISESM